MVKIYYANIGELSLGDMAQYLQQLHKKRCEKVLRCKNDGDRRRSLLAGLLLRHGLKQEGLPYEQLEFIKNPYGKPMLKDYENLHFSISHSKDYVICAIADTPIGVDIEDVTRSALKHQSKRLCAIAKKCFIEEENLFLDTSKVWQEAFLMVWTRKESYAKAIGRGLGMELSQINVLDDFHTGFFWSDYLVNDYYASVYVEKEQKEAPQWIEWRP